MDDGRRTEIQELQGKAREATEALEARGAEVLELTKRLENLTVDTRARYPGVRTRVEAAEALRQARVLVRTLGHLDESTNRASEDPFRDR